MYMYVCMYIYIYTYMYTYIPSTHLRKPAPHFAYIEPSPIFHHPFLCLPKYSVGREHSRCIFQGGWKCAIVGVPWRGVSFSMLSLGWFVCQQHVQTSAEKTEPSETPTDGRTDGRIDGCMNRCGVLATFFATRGAGGRQQPRGGPFSQGHLVGSDKMVAAYIYIYIYIYIHTCIITIVYYTL